jgi:uncharacterized cupredoxin-like copper-binding protein
MRASRIAALALAAVVLVALAVFLWPADRGLAFGEPGDPTKPARVVDIEVREKPDGRMNFIPDVVQVRQGEQIRLVLRNEGESAHRVVIATAADNVQTITDLRRNPAAAPVGGNSVHVASGQRGEILWRFTNTGDFEFAAVDPGHRDAGLQGRIVVR